VSLRPGTTPGALRRALIPQDQKAAHVAAANLMFSSGGRPMFVSWFLNLERPRALDVGHHGSGMDGSPGVLAGSR